MDAKTKERVDQIKIYAKKTRRRGYSTYSECKRALEVLDLTSPEYEEAIIDIAKELGI